MKQSVVHEYRPKFSISILLTATFLDPIHSLSKSPPLPLPFVFLNSPHKPMVCACKFCGLSNDIFRDKVPKHAFLSQSPLAPPWGLSPDQIPGALKVFRAQSGFNMIPKLSVSVSASVSIRERAQRTHLRNNGAASSGDLSGIFTHQKSSQSSSPSLS